MADPVLVENAQGQLRNYAGDLVAILSVGGYEPTAAPAFIADIVEYEVALADAPGYVRPEFTGAYTRDGDDGVLDFDTGESATVDAEGATGLIGWWIAKPVTDDEDSPLVGFVPLATGGTGTASFPLLAPDGLFRARLKTVGTLGGLSDVDLSGATDGQALTYDAATDKWVPDTVSGGGGGASDDELVTVDPTDVPLLNASTAVATWEAAADLVGVPAASVARVSDTLPYGVTAEVEQQEQLNANAAGGVLVALLEAAAARNGADGAALLATGVGYGAASSPGAALFAPADPYLLVGSDDAGDYTANSYSMPDPGTSFADGIDVVHDVAFLDDYGAALTFMEAGSHPSIVAGIDYDRYEGAGKSVDRLLSLYGEYAQIGDTPAEAGEFAPGRISSHAIGLHPRWGERVKWRHTVEADRGDGQGRVRLWLPTDGPDPDETIHGVDWRIVMEIVLDDVTSVDTDPTESWYTGLGFGSFAVFSVEFYVFGGAFSHAFRASDVQLDDTLLDEEGNVATPTGTAAVVTPSAPGGGPDLSDDDPEALGTADSGTSPDASRKDHVHEMPDHADVGAWGAWTGTAAAYAALGSYDAGTLYVVIG